MNSEQIKAKTMGYYQSVAEGHSTLVEIEGAVIEMNLGLAMTVAKKYKPFSEDNYQIGCIGLISAVRTFDMNCGVPFSSYAAFCIDRAIQSDYKSRSTDFENYNSSSIVSLNQIMSFDEGHATLEDYVEDEKAQKDMEQYIVDNQVEYLCEQYIKPAIELVAARSTGAIRMDINKWKKLEFLYIMDLAFIDSQKQRMTYKQMATALGVSVQNIKTRHLKVMNTLVGRMINNVN